MLELDRVAMQQLQRMFQVVNFQSSGMCVLCTKAMVPHDPSVHGKNGFLKPLDNRQSQIGGKQSIQNGWKYC